MEQSEPTPVHHHHEVDPAAAGFVLRLGRALHRYGYAAHHLEDVLESVSSRLRLPGQFFTTPTSVFAAFGPQDDQQTFLIRVEPGDQDLGRLAQLTAVTNSVVDGTRSPRDGSLEIDRILAEPAPYGSGITLLAFALVSGAASRFLGGGWREIAVATAIGFLTGLLALAAARVRALARVFEPVAAVLASATAAALTLWIGPYSVYNATLAGLIVLLPGLTLTIAMTELNSRHLVSGTARLTGAFMVFIGIGFGVALGARIVSLLAGGGLPPVVQADGLPAWTEAIALIVAPLAFVILLRAERRDAPWIVLSGILAVMGGRLGAHVLGLELGVFAGALAVGAASNVYARVLHRPAAVTLVPGILLLVPGSIGFRSLASLLDREVVLGVDTAFRMVLMAMALVAGLLISNIIAPPGHRY